MLNFIRRALWLQTIVVRLIAMWPPAIEHTIGKTGAIKKAFYFAFMEEIEGDYMEFGTFLGTSMISAFECNRRYSGKCARTRKFWGFDSFEGFKYFDDRDQHPYFKEGEFYSSYEKTSRRVQRHFRGRAEWELVKGYFEDTIQFKSVTDLGVKQLSTVLIDCDLGTPALHALRFIQSGLQVGSMLILDDYFAYKGSSKSGVYGAFDQFQREYPQFEFRRVFDYGHGGQGFVVANIRRLER